MEEAELTAGIDTSRIGFVQVGLEVGDVEPTTVPPVPIRGFRYAALAGVRRRPVEPAMVLPALVQCFYDALAGVTTNRSRQTPSGGRTCNQRNFHGKTKFSNHL